MKRKFWLAACLLFLLLLIQMVKSPYVTSVGHENLIYIMEGRWIKIFFLLSIFLFILNLILSVEWKFNKNPQVDDKRFLKSIISSLLLFFSIFFIIYIIIERRKEYIRQILQNIAQAPPPSSPTTASPSLLVNLNSILLTLFFLVVCLLLLLAIAGRFRKERIQRYTQEKREGEPFFLHQKNDVRKMIVAYYNHACHLLGRRGFSSKASQTPRQYEDTVSMPSKEPLKNLTTLFEEARYSHHVMTDFKGKEARHHYEKIKGETDG